MRGAEKCSTSLFTLEETATEESELVCITALSLERILLLLLFFLFANALSYI